MIMFPKFHFYSLNNPDSLSLEILPVKENVLSLNEGFRVAIIESDQ